MILTLLVIVAVFSPSLQTTDDKEQFTETLNLKTVNNHYQLYSVFTFSTRWKNEKLFEAGHYNLFPRSVGELIKRYHVAEFHLTMTQGLWKPEVWGYTENPSPPGAQLWVWFDPDVENVDAMWTGFTNVLSGMLCASLNWIKKTETVSPKYAFRPHGFVQNISSKYTRHAVLPRENLCTENLTPWLKLLPCSSHSGLASLLKPARLHHTRYLSLGLHFKQTCQRSTCHETELHLSQDISSVFDLRLSTGTKPDFSTGEIFETSLKGFCPVSSESKIIINMKTDDVKILPAPSNLTSTKATYDLYQKANLKWIKVSWHKTPQYTLPVSPQLFMHCFLTGYGDTERGIQCSVTNNAFHDIPVTFTQTVPWFLQLYLHTLKIQLQNGTSVKPDLLHFEPARIRESPAFLELLFLIPKQTSIDITVSFTRGFLTWLEHTPDAHNGLYIGAPVLTVDSSLLHGLERSQSNEAYRMYGEPLLVTIPTPDFSMPYNVICLACTVVAVAFGSLHNLTTRRFVLVSKESEEGQLKKILHKIKAKFSKRNNEDKTEENKNAEDRDIKNAENNENINNG